MEMITACEEVVAMYPTAANHKELVHYENLQRDLVRMKRTLDENDKPMVSRQNLLLTMVNILDFHGVHYNLCWKFTTAKLTSST